MNAEKIFDVMENIDEQYIIEAHQKNVIKNKKKTIRKIVVFAACFSLIISITAVVGIGIKRNSTCTVSAAEIGKEEVQLEATMPSIIYYDQDKVIMYDYIGIWVYNLKKEKLVGFCDFRPIDMTQIQGYPCVFVEASSDGRYVRFYKSDDSVKFLYNVEKDTYKEVKSYDKKLKWTFSLKDVTTQYSISDYSETYEVAKKEYLSYSLDISLDSNEAVRYKDLVIVVEKNGQKTEYKPFVVKTTT